MSLFDLVKVVTSLPQNKIGKVFIKYSEPIDLEQYLEQNRKSSPNFNDMALKLTKNLYEYQYKEQPITKNTIVSSILLFHKKPYITIKKIKVYAQEIYPLILSKNMKTYIATVPTIDDICNILRLMGLEVLD
jgi:glycerol-3-phosphate O-acyltransferase